MLEIIVLNVGLGDSVVIKTQDNSGCYYSLIDCKKIGESVPSIEFLKKNKITHLNTLFITHLHYDHISGLPDLANYLENEDCTIDNIVIPNLPGDPGDWFFVLEYLYPDTLKTLRKSILESLNKLKNINVKNKADGIPTILTMNFEGNTKPSAWRDHLHKKLDFVALSPNAIDSLAILRSAIKKSGDSGESFNSLCHVFIFRYYVDSIEYLFLFTGDLVGQRNWRNVTNRCLSITNKSILNTLCFFKVSHHGAYQIGLKTCLEKIIAVYRPFLAAISCPANNPKHPSEDTLKFFQNHFENCCIACTNVSAYCQDKLKSPQQINPFLLSAQEELFLDSIKAEKHTSINILQGVCADSFVYKIDRKGLHYLPGSGNSCILTNCEECFNLNKFTF
ncbi:MAG TPA: MBL fold metallo-hydrolase [archaeon]|nr:MBL fold metallo-hydrolase [archaeon]